MGGVGHVVDTLYHELPDDIELPTGPFGGAWEVWPYGEHVVVSDAHRGVYVLDFYPPEVTADGW